MAIVGAENMTAAELTAELDRGARFVIFQYCVSLLVVTFKRPSDIYFIRSGESTFGKSIGFTLITLLAGWWGIPWGPIYSLVALGTNLSGGEDVTERVASSLNLSRAPGTAKSFFGGANAPASPNLVGDKPIAQNLGAVSVREVDFNTLPR